LMLIATFLALLELLRRGLVRARQSEPGGEIMVYRAIEGFGGDDGRPA
jgi:chromatin segregation and condensation protein Rec8/ScpA/Scc1 (kleisin family)